MKWMCTYYLYLIFFLHFRLTCIFYLHVDFIFIFLWKRTFLRQWYDKFLREGNIAQTVVITTYCNKHKVPSGMILFRHVGTTGR